MQEIEVENKVYIRINMYQVQLFIKYIRSYINIQYKPLPRRNLIWAGMIYHGSLTNKFMADKHNFVVNHRLINKYLNIHKNTSW